MTAIASEAPLPQADERLEPPAGPLGLIVPVVAGHGGVGASGVALALADAATEHGLRALLVDRAEPARSGLAAVWTQQLASDWDGDHIVGAVARRGPVVGYRSLGGRSGDLRDWLVRPLISHAALARYGPFDVTVVDTGCDSWAAFNALPSWPQFCGRAASPDVFAVLVGRGTCPSIRLTAAVADRWHRASDLGLVPRRLHLVLAETTTVATEVRECGGATLRPLLDRVDLFPPDTRARVAGWTVRPSSSGALRAALRVLASAPGGTGSARAPRGLRRTSKFPRRLTKET